VDLAAAAQRGVRVVYAPGENAQSVAELIVGLTLALARRVYLADRMLQTGEALAIADARLTGMELHGKTLGLVGVGTVVHSMVDYYLALLIWQPVSRAAKLPASFTFSKS